MLVSKGLLETRRGKGTVVCRLTSDHLSEPMSMLVATHSDRFSLDHIHQVRTILEVAIVRLAARQATDDEVLRLKELAESMEHLDPHSAEFASLDTEFHLALAHTSHNPFLAMLVDATRDVMQSIRLRVHDRWDDLKRIYAEDLGQKVIADHAQIALRVGARDEEGAVQAMQEHLEHARQLQHQLIEMSEASTSGAVHV